MNRSSQINRAGLPAILLPLLYFMLLGSAGCRAQNAPAILEGNIECPAGWRPKAYLVQPGYFRQIISPYEGTVVDSAAIDASGHFSFQAKPWLKGPSLCALFVQQNNSRFPNDIVLPAQFENYICLVLEPGKTVAVRGNAAALARHYQLLEGSSDNRLLAQLRDLREPYFQEMERQAKEQSGESSQEFHHGSGAEDDYRAALEAFLDTTNAFYPALTAVRYCHPDNEYRDNPELFVALCKRLSTLAPDNPLTAQYCWYCSADRLPVLLGEKVPDYTLPAAGGDSLRIRQLKGRLILLDFWASWCAPCRKDIRETLVPLYAEYHDRGFEIGGISIDSSPEAWHNAIKRDGASWPNGCDLLGDASPVRDDLRFVYIPGNYLMDSEGRLLARNLHGEALKKFVADFLEK